MIFSNQFIGGAIWTAPQYSNSKLIRIDLGKRFHNQTACRMKCFFWKGKPKKIMIGLISCVANGHIGWPSSKMEHPNVVNEGGRI